MKCILANLPAVQCKADALPGLKYCARCFERGKRQTLAEKLAEQRAVGWGIEVALPGFEQCDAERAEIAIEEQRKDLSAELCSPKGSIESDAGTMETCSPLFRGHGPQGELF